MRTCLAALVVAAIGGFWPAASRAEGPRWRNLLRNASFEEVTEGGEPVAWHWAQGRAKATTAVDATVARSGKRSLKLTNPTPKAPHVYSFLAQEAWVRPGRAYVLSCYVRSAVPGTMWIGGGPDWKVRAPFPATKDVWTRVAVAFETGRDVRRWRVMILTESPTDGVWVDDVMLEEGTEPTEFVMDRPLKAGQTVLTVEPMELGENLLPNSSFESLDGTRPTGWAFNPRNTDATMAVDGKVARSGLHSLRLTNGTRFGPHVYGALTVVGGVKVKPKTAYTVSAWVRSEDPGVAWIGGGTRWRLRCRFPRTHGAWRRVSETFMTEEEERSIPILIITESPTEGLWVDDVKLEEGNWASPYVPPEAPERPVLELAVRPPQPVMSRRGIVIPVWAPSKYPPATTAFVGRELWFDGALRLPEARPGATVSVHLEAGRETPLAGATKQVDLPVGASSIEFGWQAGPLGRRPTAVTCEVEDAQRRVLARSRFHFAVYTGREVERELKKAEALLAELRKWVGQLATSGHESRALATATVLEQFIPWAREDIERGEIGRAYDAALTMQRIARARMAECDAAFAGKRAGRWPAWRYRTSPIAIDGPSFVAEAAHSQTGKVERRPVFFVGYGHFGAVRRDIEVFPRYGANFIQIEFGPRSVLPAEDETSDAAIDAFLAVCDRAAKAGVSVNLLLSPHYFPGWAYEKWPHLREFDAGFVKFDINAPEARRVIEKSLRHVIPRIKGHPAIHSLCLSNEPVCVDLSRSEASRKLWHGWLRKRYKSIDALNDAWRTKHKAFEDVGVETAFTDKPMTYDFVCFNQEQFAGWHRWMADIIHELWPGVPVHAKIMMSAHWGRHPHGIWSVSPQLFGALSEIHGNDCCKWVVHPDHAGEWASGWLGENMAYDFQRSMGDKPVFNSENHLIVDRDLETVPPEHITNVIWQGAVHGMSASTTWVWERTFDPGADASGSLMHRPDCTEAQNLACLDLNRLAREVTALQRLAPQAVLLSSLASNVYGDDHVRVMREAYTALNFCGVPIGFVTERQLAAWTGDGPVPLPLRSARLLVVPAATHVTDATVAAIGRFASRGKVLLIGPCLTRTERNGGRRIGQAPGESWPEAEAKALWPKFRALLPKVGIAPLAELRDERGEPVWGIELRAAEVGDRLVVNLASYLREPQRVRLLVGGRAAGGVERIAERGLGPVFDVPSLQPMLIEVAR